LESIKELYNVKRRSKVGLMKTGVLHLGVVGLSCETAG
jgi:hypothetical protein